MHKVIINVVGLSIMAAVICIGLFIRAIFGAPR